MWKDIKNYENLYEASDTGKIRNKTTKHILKQEIKDDGYCRVYLYKNKKRERIYVHKIIAQTFIPNPNNLSQINHKDENRSNNKASNLEWCTPKYNYRYSKAIPIIAIDMNTLQTTTYKAIRDVVLAGHNRRQVQKCLQGKAKHHHNCLWKYKEEIDNENK